MRRLIEIATHRRVTIMMFTVAIALFGFVSLSRLDLNLLPDISYPTLTIRTELTGAAPIEIENLLTKPVEEAVGEVDPLGRHQALESGEEPLGLQRLGGQVRHLARNGLERFLVRRLMPGQDAG